MIVLAFVLIFALSTVACNEENAVLDETKTYEITSDIHSLDIQLKAADFIIKRADRFSVESNLKYLSVSEKDGVLTIVDEAHSRSTYTDPILTLCVPNGTVFEDVDIITGAAKLTVDTLSANSLNLKLGAADARFESLVASSKADIKGGAGKMTVVDGVFCDLTLTMGVGELDLIAAFLGDSDLKLGVGESNITLLGGREDYKVDVEKGIGSITVDGEQVTDFGSSGNGQNHVEVKGGVGAINLKFREK